VRSSPGYSAGCDTTGKNARSTDDGIVVDIADGESSLSAIRDKINASDAGVVASIVNDASGARLSIRSKETGEENAFRITATETFDDGDPATGLSPLGGHRATGERAGPPYIGRGLMEAIYFGDLVKNEDPFDQLHETLLCTNGTSGPNATPPAGFRSCSSLLPESPLNSQGCSGDCVSGRHNEGRADINIAGGEPAIRVGRFGLRAAGTTMLQFDVGGTRGEMGMTSIFSPNEEPNVVNMGLECDQQRDPEIKAEVVRNLRAMIRLFGPPDYPAEFRQNPPQTQLAMDIQAGARLFGLDLDAFRSRTTQGATPVRRGDPDADRGMAIDRALNCVGCHTPIQMTGESPAEIGKDVLSNKWAPIFSDLLIHKMPTTAIARPESLYFEYYPNGGINSVPAGMRPLRDYLDAVFANGNLPNLVSDPFPTGLTGARPGISRNVGDFAVPASVTGIAFGDEFRTAPLMGLGKTGPPFFHDARVYVNTTNKRIQDTSSLNPDASLSGQSFPNERGVDPAAPAAVNAVAETVTTYRVAAGTGTGGTDFMVNERLVVNSVDNALIAAIELHDLPAPPLNNYAICPPFPPDREICSRASRFRGEAVNTLEKWHNLTKAQQLQVIRFLESL